MMDEQFFLDKELGFACEGDDFVAAQNAIERGANVNALAGVFNRPLVVGPIAYENMDIFKLLLEKGLDVNIRWQPCMYTPLMVCVIARQYAKPTKEQKEMIEMLLDKGADINATDHMGNTALMWAFNYEQGDLAELLINRGADVTKKGVNANGEIVTALSIAQKNRMPHTMKAEALLKEKLKAIPVVLATPIVNVAEQKKADQRIRG